MAAGVLTGIAAVIAAVSLSCGAVSEPLRTRHAAPEFDAPVGVGCYFHRQRLYCARWCYLEIDGHRYCTERQRDAYSQAPGSPDSYRYALPTLK
jgi:hypothetical protein